MVNGNNFRNLTAKVWANFDNPIKSYDFPKFWLIYCMPPSQVALCYNLWCHNRTTTVYNGTVQYTHISQIFSFHENIYSLYFYTLKKYRYRAKMIVHAFMIELDQLDYWYPRGKKRKFFSCESCSLVTSHILAEFRSVQRGRHTKLWMISSLKWIIQIC